MATASFERSVAYRSAGSLPLVLLHNSLHNMAADVTISNHLTKRSGVWQYVRRVPEDLRDHFPFSRVQKSLRTSIDRKAREAATELDALWDRRFKHAREREGRIGDRGDLSTIDTSGWTWPDWEALASWFEMSLAEEDWQVRLATMAGLSVQVNADPSRIPWRDERVARDHLDRERLLKTLSVTNYGEQRRSVVQGYVRGLGVVLSRTDPYDLRFMAACLSAELSYLALVRTRESRQGGFGNTHPDIIEGPWRQLRSSPSSAMHEAGSTRTSLGDDPGAASLSPRVVDPSNEWSGKTLQDCIAKWTPNRVAAKQAVRDHHLNDMRKTVATFERHSGLRDIGLIGRKHVLAFRYHLSSQSGFKVATVNKKVSYVTSLLSTARNAGWIEREIGTKIFLQVPGDEGAREAFSSSQLAAIFAHRVFTKGHRSHLAKACGELQFWLPLIACTHGMISSEILQLGPDTVLPHEDHPEILCFAITNAGGRTTKTLARRRWMPIRRELLELGLLDLVEQARREDRRWLWPEMDEIASHDVV